MKIFKIICFFLTASSAFGMIDYHKLMQSFEKKLTFHTVHNLKKIDPLLHRRIQPTVVLANYLIEKYNKDKNCIFYSIGGSPALIIPCCQFLDQKNWSNYRHAAFSGGWYDLYGQSRYTEGPTEEEKLFFRDYLNKIGLHPKNIIEGKERFLFFDLMVSGQGTRSFLSMIFEWTIEFYSSTDPGKIFKILKDKIAIVSFLEFFNTALALKKSFTESLPRKDFMFEQCAPTEEEEKPYNLPPVAPYLDFLKLSVSISKSYGSRLVPSFKKDQWKYENPLLFSLDKKMQTLLYQCYLEIRFPDRETRLHHFRKLEQQ